MKRGKLSRHIKLKHGNIARVQTAMALPEKEKNTELAKMRYDGVMEYNKKQAELDIPVYQSEWKEVTTMPLRRCSACNKTVLSRLFSKHRYGCSRTTDAPIAPIPTGIPEMTDIPIKINSGFKKDILGRFWQDRIGKLCINDKIILQIGGTLYNKIYKKLDKTVEVARSVRWDMRRIAHCYNIFKEQVGVVAIHKNALDIFNKDNFYQLSEAVEIYTKR